MAVKAIPDGYHSVTPFINVKGVAKLIDFLKAALGAEEVMRMPGPDGTVMHAEVSIGNSRLMLGEPIPVLSTCTSATWTRCTNGRPARAPSQSVRRPISSGATGWRQ